MTESPSAADIFSVVKKHILEIIGDVDEERITPQASMRELGASSLDIVDVISCTLRELRLRVPRGELGDVDRIQPLVDLLSRVAAECPLDEGLGEDL
jgi:acyl carrier protein